MRRTATMAAITALLLLVGGIAVASIPDSSGVIHGCRKNSDGSVRVIDSDAGQTCAHGWTALNWSQTGPRGPAGPASLAVLDVAMAQPVFVEPGSSNQGNQACPSQGGYIAIGGGVDADAVANPDLDQLSAGVSSGGGVNLVWSVRMHNHGTVTHSFTVHAFCVIGTVEFMGG